MRKSMEQLKSDLTTLMADNTVGNITPQVMRDFLTSFIDAIRPAYGLLTRDTPNAQALTTTPQALIFESGAVSDVPDYTVNAAAGTITRAEAGSIRSIFNGTVEGANGVRVLVAVFKDGVQTSWISSATCTGAGEPVALMLNFLAYNDTSAVYDIRVSVVSGSASITFDDCDWVIETVPVNSYI